MTFLNKNKKFLAGLVALTFISILLLPVLSQAALVNCDGVKVKCDFNKFIELINIIINWIISMATAIFTISAIYGGFLYLTSGGDSGKKGKATGILWNTLYGFVIILVSWLIVYTILTVMVGSDQKNSVLRFIGSSSSNNTKTIGF